MESFSLHETVLEFDRYLNRLYLASLSLDEARILLGKIESFNAFAQTYYQMDAATPEEQYLINAGCRLCSDLSEKIMMRLVDILQDKEHQVDVLSRKLRRQMQDRVSTGTLLKKAQQTRNETNLLGESVGLGVIL